MSHLGRVISILTAMLLFRLASLLGPPGEWATLGMLIVWAAALWAIWLRLRYQPVLLADWRAQEQAAGGLQLAAQGAENLCLACLGLLVVTFSGTWLVGAIAALAGRQAVLQLSLVRP